VAADPEFIAYCEEIFSGLGAVRVGRLFGGAALYIDDAMFAMVQGNQLYMKADAQLAKAYADAGSDPFFYQTRSGVRIIPGLMGLPDSALEDPDEALAWARRSLVPAELAALARQRKRQR